MTDPLGIAVGYWVLFSLITAFHALMEVTPSIVNKSKKWFMNWLYFYRELSAKQNEDGCKALLLWFLLHQHLIKKKSGMMLNHMLDCNYLLPKYNEQFYVETAYGRIYFVIISADDLNIHGFRVAVRRRSGFFRSQKMENLDRLITFMTNDVCWPCRIYYHEKSETVVKKNNNPFFDERVPEELKAVIKKVYAQFEREYRARQAATIQDAPLLGATLVDDSDSDEDESLDFVSVEDVTVTEATSLVA